MTEFLQCECPFKGEESDMMSALARKQEAIQRTMNTFVKILDKHEDAITVMPKKLDDLRGAIERFGASLVRAFVFVGMSILGVVVVLGLMVLVQGNLKFDADARGIHVTPNHNR